MFAVVQRMRDRSSASRALGEDTSPSRLPEHASCFPGSVYDADGLCKSPDVNVMSYYPACDGGMFWDQSQKLCVATRIDPQKLQQAKNLFWSYVTVVGTTASIGALIGLAVGGDNPKTVAIGAAVGAVPGALFLLDGGVR